MPSSVRKYIFFSFNNSIPFIGVFVYGWDALFVVQLCFIETCIASLFDYVKLPFLKDDPAGSPDQGGFVVLSFILLPMLLIYSLFMTVALDTNLLPWKEFYLPASVLVASYTAQFVHFMVAERFNPNLFRGQIAQFTVLRDLILMGAIIVLPWVGLALLPLWNMIDAHFHLQDSYKLVIVLLVIFRTFCEVKLIGAQSGRLQAPGEDL